MKKILLIISICLLFTGCSLLPRKTTIIGNRINDNVISTDYGSYTIPSTWTKRDDHSTANKYFFANKNDNNTIPDNISVEMGTNKYSKDDHMAFNRAILAQLSMQVKGSGMTINGSGSTTKNGYPVYTYRMTGKGQTIVQHYIVGDYKYVLVHETIWHGDTKDTDDAAKAIVNSFKWKE